MVFLHVADRRDLLASPLQPIFGFGITDVACYRRLTVNPYPGFARCKPHFEIIFFMHDVWRRTKIWKFFRSVHHGSREYASQRDPVFSFFRGSDRISERHRYAKVPAVVVKTPLPVYLHDRGQIDTAVVEIAQCGFFDNRLMVII